MVVPSELSSPTPPLDGIEEVNAENYIFISRLNYTCTSYVVMVICCMSWVFGIFNFFFRLRTGRVLWPPKYVVTGDALL